MIVASSRRDILQHQRFTAVVCSPRFAEPVRADEVLLASAADGRCDSELREPTVAVCGWTANLAVGEIVRVGGFVGGQVLREVFAKAGITLPHER